MRLDHIPAPVRRIGQLALGVWLSLGLLPVSAGGQDKQAADRQTVTGTVSDDMCANANHTAMRMGATDADCAKACVDAHGAAYVLFDGKTTYQLSDQKTAATLVAKRVRVVGTLDQKTRKITVESMRAEP